VNDASPHVEGSRRQPGRKPLEHTAKHGPHAAPVPRLTLTPVEAAASLGVSRDYFDEHVRDELRLIRRGRLVLVPVKELERWADQSAALVFDASDRTRTR
jgi:excisionase family DNA binding protein